VSRTLHCRCALRPHFPSIVHTVGVQLAEQSNARCGADLVQVAEAAPLQPPLKVLLTVKLDLSTVLRTAGGLCLLCYLDYFGTCTRGRAILHWHCSNADRKHTVCNTVAGLTCTDKLHPNPAPKTRGLKTVGTRKRCMYMSNP
jgi:hypothetical protein